MKGWVYIITNKSMPNLLNIGFSNNDPALKAEELNKSEIPHPYVVEYDALVNEPKEIAQKIQAILSHCHENKGWFRCDVAKAIIAIRQAAADSIIVENNRNAEVKKPEIFKKEPAQTKPEGEKMTPKSLDMQDLYTAVIGEKNTDYYLAKFAEFDKQPEGLKSSWNWSAFLFNNGWTLYRKMYGWFFTFWSIAILLNTIEKATSISHSVAVETIVYTYTFFITLIIAIFFGFFADSLYYKKVKKKIESAQQTIKNEAKLIEFLQSQGGVHNWVMWLFSGLAVSGIIVSIVVPIIYPAQKDVSPPAAVAAAEPPPTNVNKEFNVDEELKKYGYKPPPVSAEPAVNHREGNCISGNCANGQGIWIYPSGVNLEGEWKSNEFKQGTLTAPDGRIQSGKFISDSDGYLLLQGKGSVTFANGGKYVGEFKAGKYEGQGSLTNQNGEQYVGTWVNNKREGQGTQIYSTGDKYVGEFGNNVRNGYGTYYSTNGTVTAGIWRDNQLVQ